MIKPLRIAIIAPLHQSVPPKPGKYSDKIKEIILPKHEFDKEAKKTAQIVNELVEGLVARGHQVTLFASPDSNTSAHLICDATYGAFRGKRVMPGIFNHAYRWMFEQVRRRADKFDVLHFHTFEHLPHIDDFMGKTVTTLYDQPAGGTVADLNPLAELFPNAPIVVRRDLEKEVSKHWKNVIGTVNEEAEDGTDLTKSMVKLGHDVTLLATVGTETSAKLIEIPFKTNPWACQDNWVLCQLPVVYSQEMVKRHAHEYDILQFHCPSYFIEFRHFIEHAVCTQHMPIDDTVLFKQFSHIPSISISEEQQKLTPIESMVKLGHDVTLLATVGTETSAKLIEIPFKTNPWACQDNWVLCQLPVVYSQEMVKRHAHEYDILQFHCPSYFIEFRHFIEHAVCTQHMPIDDTVLFKQFSHIPSISISEEQQKLTPIVLDLNWVGSVHNGINLDEFTFNETPKTGGDQYLAWMGRMVPDKGVDVAIKFAIESNMKLKIAAQIVDERKKWWEKRILPLIEKKHSKLIEFVGEVGPEQRNEFLGNATAFLFTPKWDEPFGLSMIEAMATGTPVIAIQRGAVGEIVNEQNGVTFDYEDNQMIFDFIDSKNLIEKVSTLDRAKIRQTVEGHWSLEQMSTNYVKVYRNVLSKNCLH
uniref:Glycos_transf_1 domain-containing protein n=1 Tax=Globodera pallida TaxID=36090 RepID=A0A183CCT6_GLOPA